MKKALSGPAKRTAKTKRLPERRAMIAAARRRASAMLAIAAKRTHELDRASAKHFEKLRPVLARWIKRARSEGRKLWRALGRRARPVAVLFLRGFGRIERMLRRASLAATRSATRASALVTPRRAICVVVVASSVCLAVAQFVSYRSIEIGGSAYAGLPADAPTVGGKTAGEASSYVLVAVAVLAALAGILALRPGRRGLARAVVVLGLLAVAVILAIDMPTGLDASTQASRFSGATAVLEPAFYAQLAAAAGLILGGLLYTARPCRIRINLSGRAASARRRRRRRRASSPDRAARRRLPRRSAAGSAPASQP
jgi:hypothetical protein